MPSVNVVYGNKIVVRSVGPVERVLRFLAKPFVQVWVNRDIVQAILDGRQPRHLNLHAVRGRQAEVPVDWQEQRVLFGFAK